MAAEGFYRRHRHEKALFAWVGFFFFLTSQGFCTLLLIPAGEGVADGVVNEGAGLASQSPSFDVELWRSALLCCKFGDHLLSASLESCCCFRLKQDMAPLSMGCVGCASDLAVNGMLFVLVCNCTAPSWCHSWLGSGVVEATANWHQGQTKPVAHGGDEEGVRQRSHAICPGCRNERTAFWTSATVKAAFSSGVWRGELGLS